MRRFLAAAVVVLLAVPLAAHGAANPIVAAAKRTAAVKSSTFQLHVTTTIAGRGTVVMTGSGVQDGTDVKLSMRTTAAGTSEKIDAILRNEGGAYVMYMRSPALQAQLPEGKSWLRVDLSKQAASLGFDFAAQIRTSFAPLEAGLVSTKRLAREKVAGQHVTRYRALVDMQRAARAIPAYGKRVAEIEKATGVRFGRSTYDVWVAGDGRIRRMRFSTPAVNGAGRGMAVQTITFLSFGRPAKIAAPPPAQVLTP